MNEKDLRLLTARITADYLKIESNYSKISKLVLDNDKITKLVNKKLYALERYLGIIYFNEKYHESVTKKRG